uniref:N-acetyltransferase domain-containing protein n=1 Tax=Clastoptera arizonana TaxID=38151 RepID=A0A1B6BXJ0_9HEMI
MIYRQAIKDDCYAIRTLIQELADFEKMPDGPKISSKVLERDGFEVNPPCFGCFVAEMEDHEVDKYKNNNRIVGFALYNYAYATWTGKKMYLEDLIVTESFRSKGIGKKLFLKVVNKAKETGCAQLEFVVLSWNPAKEFYMKLGCNNMTETEEWSLYRLDAENMSKLICS